MPAFSRHVSRRRQIVVSVAGLCVTPGVDRDLFRQAKAAAFPNRPVRIVVPVPPGVSSIDLAARAVAEAMRGEFAAPVLVENQPGGGGILAAETVLRASPDGHTLFLGGVGSLVDVFLAAGRQPLDPLRDLVPIGRLTRDHWMVAATPMLGVGSVAHLIAAAQDRPGGLTYPSFGAGSPFHLAAARFCSGVGIDAMHVPYRDSYMADLLAGRLSFVVQSSSPVQPHVAAGRLHGLAVLSTLRLPALPDMPTIAEAGYPNLEYNSGVVLFAPGQTPAAVVERLNAALNGALRVPAIQARFAELGLETVNGSPADAERFVLWNMAANAEARGIAFSNPAQDRGRATAMPEGRPR